MKYVRKSGQSSYKNDTKRQKITISGLKYTVYSPDIAYWYFIYGGTPVLIAILEKQVLFSVTTVIC